MTSTRYSALQPVLLRAPLLPVEACLALADDPRVALADPRLRAAVAVAAPELLTQLDRPDLGARERERAARSLQRYTIRMATRPTPFGLFAGVALAGPGPRASVVVGARHRSRMRPDLGWLCGLAARLESRPEVRRRLRVHANPEVTVSGGRARLPARLAVDGAGEARAVNIRATPVVDLVLSRARIPVPWPDLATEVLSATGTGPDRVDALLTELWEQTFLLTELRPPLTHPAPAAYLAERLAEIGEAAAPERAVLDELLAGMAAWDALDWPERPAAGARLARVARCGVPDGDGRYVQVDVALDLAGTLPPAVGDAAAQAAEVMLRLSPLPSPGLSRYMARFLERYGTDREVGLLDLLDPERGLGPPEEHASAAPPPHQARLDSLLLSLASDALRERRSVVTLDRAVLDALAPPVDPATAPSSLDLLALVLAASPADVEAGRFRLLVGPNLGAQAAGRNLGRFASLLGPGADAVLRSVADADRRDDPDALHAELVYLPRAARAANVAVRPAVWDYEVVLGTTPGVPAARTIPVSELRVAVRDGRFRVRWLGHAGDVVVHAGHMLSGRAAPAAVRFLEEVARCDRRPLRPFSWGPAVRLPFLPRVEVGRAVLAPARWRMDAAAAASLAPRDAGFADRLARWRAGWNVPGRVYLAEGDNRLLLDLESSAQVDQLRAALRRLPDGLVLDEPLPDLPDAWLPGPGGTHHVCEIVVPLVRARVPRAAAETPAARADGPEPVMIAARDRLRAPGSDWLYLKLYGPASEQDDLLTGPVRAMAQLALGSGLAERWFFLRYADPDPHLRIRFGGDAARLAGLFVELAPVIQELLAEARCSRAAYDTYEREIERYGGPAAIAVAEDIFAADSAATVELLDLVREGQPLDRAILGVWDVDDLLASLGLDAARRLEWCRTRVRDRRPSGADYRVRGGTLRQVLADPSALGDGPSWAAAVGILARRRHQLRPLGEALSGLEAAGRLTRPLPRILDSLVHVHANRFLEQGGRTEEHVLGLLLRTRESLHRHRHMDGTFGRQALVAEPGDEVRQARPGG